MTRRSLIVESLERRNLLASNGWDGVGQGSSSLSFYVGELPDDIDATRFRDTIEAAFAVWTDVVDVDVAETATARARNSIDIQFASLDGSGGTLAQAYFPDDVTRGRLAGDITFDSDDNWEFGNALRSAATDVMLVAVHEIGHALGLDHIEDNRSSIMYPTVSSTKVFSSLNQVDVAAILQLYAPRPDLIRGDFDRDGTVNVGDVDLLFNRIASGEFDTDFDLNADGGVDADDRDVMILDVLDSTYGDANLDGRFNTVDLVVVFQAGLYLTSPANDTNWSTGDWNGDGLFNTNDLVLAFQQGDFVGV